MSMRTAPDRHLFRDLIVDGAGLTR